MTIEGEFHENKDVIDSIPEIDSEIIKFESVKEIVSKDYKDTPDFNIDLILDKIHQKGLDALSDEEKEFLDKKSKDL